MIKKLTASLALILILCVFNVAADLGSNNPRLPKIIAPSSITTITNINGSTLSVNISEYTECWITVEGLKCDVSDITYDEISGGDVNALGYTGTFSFLAGAVGGIDMTGDPWWLSGTDLELERELTVNGYSHLNNTYPLATLMYDLGSGALRWRRLFVQNISAEEVETYNAHVLYNLTVDGFVNGVNVSALNSPQLGLITLTHKNGTVQVFNPAVDTDASRGFALRAAIGNATVNSLVQLSASTFGLSLTSINVPENITIRGSGYNTRVAGLVNTNPIFKVTGSTVIKDMLISNSAAGGAGIQIGTYGGGYNDSIFIQNVQFNSQFDSFWVYGSGAGNEPLVTFDNCYWTKNYYDGGVVIFGNVIIQNSIVYQTGTTVNYDDDNAAGFMFLNAGNAVIKDSYFYWSGTAPINTWIKLHNWANVTTQNNYVIVETTSPKTAYGFYASDGDGFSGTVNSYNDIIILKDGAGSRQIYGDPSIAQGTFNLLGGNIVTWSGLSTINILKQTDINVNNITTNTIAITGNQISNGTASFSLQDLNRTGAGGAGGGIPILLNTSRYVFINNSYPQTLIVNGTYGNNITMVGQRCGGTPTSCESYGQDEIACLTQPNCYYDYDTYCDDTYGFGEMCCLGTPPACTTLPPSDCTFPTITVDGCGMIEDDVFSVIGEYGNVQQKGLRTALVGGNLPNYDFALTVGSGAIVEGDYGLAAGKDAKAGIESIALGSGSQASSSNAVAIGGCLADGNGICIGQGNEVAPFGVGLGQGILVSGVYTTGVGYNIQSSGDNGVQIGAGQLGGESPQMYADNSMYLCVSASDETGKCGDTSPSTNWDGKNLLFGLRGNGENTYHNYQIVDSMIIGRNITNNYNGSYSIGRNFNPIEKNSLGIGYDRLAIKTNKTMTVVYNNFQITGNLSVKTPYWTGYDNSTQAFINTANVQVINISNNNDYDSYGISVIGRQNLTFKHSGDYSCRLMPEFFQNGGGALVTFWYQKNGVDAAWSNSRYSMTNNEYHAPNIEFQFDIENPTTDNIRFMWWSDSTSTQIYSSGALTAPTRPSIPGIILNCNKVSDLTP